MTCNPNAGLQVAPAPAGAACDTRRPRLAVMANCLTPYRVHLHNCIIDELPEVELHTLITHGRGDFDFQQYEASRFEVEDFSDPEDSANNNILKAPHLLLKERKKAQRIIRYLREKEIDALIGLIPSYYSYYLTYRACPELGIKLFVRSDANIHNERNASRLKLAAKKWWYARWIPCVTGVMPMGGLGEQFFRQYWPHDDRMYRVPYWPNLERYAERDEQQIAEFQKKFSLDPQRKRLLYCGRLIPVKRVDLLIDAFCRLAKDRPDWDLMLMGAGALEEQLRSRVPESLKDRILWTGFLESRELVAGYHSAHALVLPSDREPWALVVPEALAAGLPVVVSDVVGAAHEMIRPGVNGEIFVAGDLGGLTGGLEKVTDPVRHDEYRQNAQRGLQEWLAAAQPVDEIRRALQDCKLI